ncbi:hypothetical protein RFI_09309 [Reticulomyxa filosa]|uniref:Uncharacterized protein n=1 Tax=Reticulomyxa filosa TaxID=46433 RepID=X6NPG1_RETFI|nr:hypothetical protein RFI_09309 [Reticulomyxa filosa]|eukprot:ETO27823.1 hypothetical protein RFI_09309 [Reticulomyxa filosa]
MIQRTFRPEQTQLFVTNSISLDHGQYDSLDAYDIQIKQEELQKRLDRLDHIKSVQSQENSKKLQAQREEWKEILQDVQAQQQYWSELKEKILKRGSELQQVICWKKNVGAPTFTRNCNKKNKNIVPSKNKQFSTYQIQLILLLKKVMNSIVCIAYFERLLPEWRRRCEQRNIEFLNTFENRLSTMEERRKAAQVSFEKEKQLLTIVRLKKDQLKKLHEKERLDAFQRTQQIQSILKVVSNGIVCFVYCLFIYLF